MTRTTRTILAVGVALTALTGTAHATTQQGVAPTPGNPAGCRVTAWPPVYAGDDLVNSRGVMRCRLPTESPADRTGALVGQFRLLDADGHYYDFWEPSVYDLYPGDMRATVLNQAYCRPDQTLSWKNRTLLKYQFDGEWFMVVDTSDATLIACGT